MNSFFKGILTFVLSIGILLMVFLIFLSKIIVPVFPIIIGAMTYFASKTQRILIKKNYTSINNLSEGLVKIEGKVNSTTTLETPYFKDECVGYSYEEAEIDYFEESGDERKVSANYKMDFPDFYLSDATGKIKVNADGLDVTFLAVKTKKIKKIRHSERTLKNGDEITILGTIVKNKWNELILQKSDENPFTISDKNIIIKQEKSFQIIKLLLPYLVLMYVGVNYFLFFAPEKNLGKSDAFSYFSIFGMPILGLAFGYVGKNSDGFMRVFFSLLASICLGVTFLSVPLIFLFLMIELEFYRIFYIWLTILVCTTLAFVFNYKKLDGVFDDV